MMVRTVLLPELLLDGTGAPPRRHCAVIVESEHIAAVLPSSSLPAEVSACKLALRGATLLPGLIDAHVHLTLGDGLTPRQTMMQESNDMLLLRAASQAREGLLAGVTTMRDCGGRDDVTFILRDGIQRGATAGPRLLLCGQPLTPPRGHCYFMHGEVESREDMARRIQQLAQRGADFIKVMVTGGGLTPGSSSLTLQFSRDDLAFMVAEAARHGLPVSAHAHSREATRIAVDVGAATIEHATFAAAGGIIADEETVRLMAEGKATVVPTAIPAANAVRAGRTLGLARELGISSADFLTGREAALRLMHRHGVRLVAGSDAGATGVQFTDVVGEIALLAQIGMSNEQAMAAATGLAAEALGLADIGRVAPGYRADLLAVRGDATADIGALTHPVLVMMDGRVVRRADEQVSSTN